MLVPAKRHFSASLSPTDSVIYNIGSELPTRYLLDPIILVRNIGSEPINVIFRYTLDLGDGVNPLYSGAYPSDLINYDVAAGSLLSIHVPSPSISSPPDIESYELILTSSALNLVDNILHIVVSGVYDDAISVGSNNSGVTIL